MSAVKNYLSLVKFSHTIFAMPFALIGFALGIAALKNNNIELQNSVIIIRFLLGASLYDHSPFGSNGVQSLFGSSFRPAKSKNGH